MNTDFIILVALEAAYQSVCSKHQDIPGGDHFSLHLLSVAKFYSYRMAGDINDYSCFITSIANDVSFDITYANIEHMETRLLEAPPND